MTLRPSRVDDRPVRPYRPPIGIPEVAERNRLQGWLGSFGLHLLFALIFIVPYLAHEVFSVRENRSAGGAGPAGGGGGGRNGTGGAPVERVHYVPIAAPTPAPRQDTPRPTIPVPPPPPVETPRPPVVPPPPPAASPALETPPVAAAPVEVPAAAAVAGAATVGTGGGTGNDGSAGSGPGTGGGVGSGVGTGRGTGVGPGTGGGADSIYPPTPVSFALPPLDPPRKLRPYTLVAYFDVDERGGAKLLGFNETSDRGFNRRVRAVLDGVRFRPATRLDGRAVRDTGKLEFDYP